MWGVFWRRTDWFRSDQIISKNTINAAWIKDELFKYLNVLYQCDFDVRAIVCDNHQSILSKFKNPQSEINSHNAIILERYYAQVQI